MIADLHPVFHRKSDSSVNILKIESFSSQCINKHVTLLLLFAAWVDGSRIPSWRAFKWEIWCLQFWSNPVGTRDHATTLEWTQSCPGRYIWFSFFPFLVLFLHVSVSYAILNVNVVVVVGVIVKVTSDAFPCCIRTFHLTSLSFCLMVVQILGGWCCSFPEQKACHSS